jgi:hypothetical protein
MTADGEPADQYLVVYLLHLTSQPVSHPMHSLKAFLNNLRTQTTVMSGYTHEKQLHGDLHWGIEDVPADIHQFRRCFICPLNAYLTLYISRHFYRAVALPSYTMPLLLHSTVRALVPSFKQRTTGSCLCWHHMRSALSDNCVLAFSSDANPCLSPPHRPSSTWSLTEGLLHAVVR